MAFRITGLDPARFLPLYGADERTLAERVVRRVIADGEPGYPDWVTLTDAARGETLLLLNYTHQPAATPFRASHAIFVREGATEPARYVDAVPPSLETRTIALRAFDREDMLIAAELAQAAALAPAIDRLLASADTAYLHAHYAAHGCFAARVDRN